MILLKYLLENIAIGIGLVVGVVALGVMMAYVVYLLSLIAHGMVLIILLCVFMGILIGAGVGLAKALEDKKYKQGRYR